MADYTLEDLGLASPTSTPQASTTYTLEDLGLADSQPQYAPWALNTVKALDPVVSGALKGVLSPLDLVDWGVGKATGWNEEGPSISTEVKMLADQFFGTQDIVKQANEAPDNNYDTLGNVLGFIPEAVGSGGTIAKLGNLAQGTKIVQDLANVLAKTKVGRAANVLGAGIASPYTHASFLGDVGGYAASEVTDSLGGNENLQMLASVLGGASGNTLYNLGEQVARPSIPWKTDAKTRAANIIGDHSANLSQNDPTTRALFDAATSYADPATRKMMGDYLIAKEADQLSAIPMKGEPKDLSVLGEEIRKPLVSAMEEAQKEPEKLFDAYRNLGEPIKVEGDVATAFNDAIGIIDSATKANPSAHSGLKKAKEIIKEKLPVEPEKPKKGANLAGKVLDPEGRVVDSSLTADGKMIKSVDPVEMQNILTGMVDITAEANIPGRQKQAIGAARAKLLEVADPVLVAGNQAYAKFADKFKNKETAGVVAELLAQAEAPSGSMEFTKSAKKVVGLIHKMDVKDFSKMEKILGQKETRELVRPVFDHALSSKIETAMKSKSAAKLEGAYKDIAENESLYKKLYGDVTKLKKTLKEMISDAEISRLASAYNFDTPEVDSPMFRMKAFLTQRLPVVSAVITQPTKRDPIVEDVMRYILKATAPIEVAKQIKNTNVLPTVSRIEQSIGKSLVSPMGKRKDDKMGKRKDDKMGKRKDDKMGK